MKLQKSVKIALNILLHSKLRSWLTIIGIVIGIAAVVSIVSIGQGAQQSLEERLGGMGADIITISPGFTRAIGPTGGFREVRGVGGAEGEMRVVFEEQTSTASSSKNLTDKDVQFLKSISNVKYASGIVSGRGEIYYLGEHSSVSIEGVDPLVWKDMVTTELESGRYLIGGDANAVVVSNRVANSLFKNKIEVNRQITIKEKPFRVVGILKESGFGGGDNTVFMSIKMARTILGDVGDKKFDSISVKVEDANLIDETLDEITKKLMVARGIFDEKKKDFTVTSAKAIQERISEIVTTMSIFLGAIAAISLIVGAIGISNTMFTSVLEKTKEIGIMKAIGAKNKDIMLIFLLTSGMIGLVGGLIGITLGVLGSMGLEGISIRLGMMGAGESLKTAVTPELLIFSIAFSVLIGMLSGIVPAYRASKMKLVDALRYE